MGPTAAKRAIGGREVAGLRPPTLGGAPLSLVGAGCVQRCRKSGPCEGAREEARAGRFAWQGHSHGDPVGCRGERVFLAGCSII